MLGFCTKTNRPVTDSDCLACFNSPTASEIRAEAKQRRMNCVSANVEQRAHAELMDIDMSPEEKLIDAAGLAAEFIRIRFGGFAEGRALAEYLDEAVRAMRDQAVEP